MNPHEPSATAPERVVFSGPPLVDQLSDEEAALQRRVHTHLLAWAAHLRNLIRSTPGGLDAVSEKAGLTVQEVRDLVLRPEEALLDDFFAVLTVLQAAPAVPTATVSGAIGRKNVAMLDFGRSWRNQGEAAETRTLTLPAVAA